MNYKYYIAYIIVFNSLLGIAQSTKDFDKQFNAALISFNDNNYDKSDILFKTLSSTVHKKNKHLKQAKYFLALTKFNQKANKESYQQFQQLLYDYPDWKDNDQALFMLANISFENKDYESAFDFGKKLELEKLKIEEFKMKTFYLLNIDNVHKLKELHNQFPDDEALAQVLAQRLTEKTFLWLEDKMLLQFLMQTFVLDEELESRMSEMSQPQLKEEYHVSLLLPFNYDKIKYDLSVGKTTNHFTIDIFNGVSLALDSLKMMEGSKISLHCYDTKHDVSVVDSLLHLKDLAQSDLILGPIYKEENKLVSNFCNRMMIAKVNLMSKVPTRQDSLVGLYINPSMANMGSAMAQICVDSVGTDSILLVANNYKKDSLLVKSFVKKFEELGGQNIKVEIWDRYSTMHLKMTEMRADSSMYKGIVIANSKKNSISNVCSFYTVNNLGTPLIVPGDWAKNDQILLHSLKFAQVYFMNYTIQSDEQIKSKEGYYLEKYGVPINNFSELGYNVVSIFASYLKLHGKDFYQMILEDNRIVKSNGLGVNFYKNNANINMPIVRYSKNQFVEIK